MKKFLGFVRKEFHHIFRDRRTLMILFGMPVVQLLLFGYVIVNDLRNASIAVCDLASDQMSREITEKIISSGFFRLGTYLESERDIHEILKQGKVREVIIFEKDFSRKIQSDGRAAVQVIADASEPNTARMMVNYTQGILTSYTQELNRDIPHAAAIIPEVRMEYNPELKGVYMFVPGIIAMLLTLISTLLTSIALTREKELGTMEVLLVSPLRPVQIILGKVTPYLLLSLINAIVILLMAYLVFGVPVVGSVVLLLAMTMLYILTALSLGILISSLTGSQQVAMMISMVGLLLPTILLSGFIYPVENMPVWLQAICHIMPPKYFITIIKDIMLMGNGLMYFWKEALVLVLMTSVFIVLSVKKFKIRLR